ncbi:DEAD/DEAH box helicase [Paludisphaera sp.]|uniref:DEAD/DEAH box helicase n=1 Tax=Paludisphaera sp. TaxID=2017432 RepID=UPI00301BC8A5
MKHPTSSDSDFRLRPYQLKAVDELEGEYRLGKTAVLLVAPTGSGKTAVGCHFVRQAVDQGKRCLWIAHRSELIRQASQHLARDYRVRHGIIKAGVGDYNPRYPVQVASVQTLARRQPLDAVGLLVIDEAHHATAETYLRIIESHPDAQVLGLTATPWRLTGRKLGSLFDAIVAVANYPFLIGQGYLVRPRVFLPRDLPDFSTVRCRGGEFDEDQAAEIMERPKLVGDVLDQWRKHACEGGKPRSTIIFACNVAHSRHLVSAFARAGVAAEHLDAQVPEDEREAILDRLTRGKTAVVSNVMLLSEGFDCPPVSCVVVARPTASRTLFVQMVGRALRPCAAPAKADCIILDHAGNSYRHGLLAEITNYELEQGDFFDPTGARASCKRCPECGAVSHVGTQVCPECRYSFSLARKLPGVAAGDLHELGAPSVARPDALADGAESVPFGKVDERTEPARTGRSQTSLDSILRGVSSPLAAAYRDALVDLTRPGSTERLSSLRPAISRLTQAEKLAFVEAGLLSERPHLWLEQMLRAGCLKPIGLGPLAELSAVRFDGYEGPSHFERTKRALQRAKPDLMLRMAALFAMAGVPGLVEQARKYGFKAVRAYGARSAEVAAEAFDAIGFGGEPRELCLELIRHHEYLFEQLLNNMASQPTLKLCQRWRNRLGPLWRQHFEFAEALWDGYVLRWIRRNLAAVSHAIDATEEKLCDVKPEEACPLDGNAIIARYGLPVGPWVRIMKDEIGRWCLANPATAGDSGALLAAADSIFERNRQDSPAFNHELPFLSLDEAALAKVQDPLGVKPLLVEASRLTVAQVSGWATGYRRKAVAAVIRAVSTATNNKQTASLCAQYLAQIASALKDVTLGEVLKGLASPRRSPSEVAESIRKGREAVASVRRKYEREATKELSLSYALALRGVGHFEDAHRVARSLLERYPQETAIEKLVASICRMLSNPEGTDTGGGEGDQ